MGDIYDVVIIGGGPAGLTAAIYSCRARMKTLILEKSACGGQVMLADTIENFPGFPGGVKGLELAEWFTKQAEHFGLETKLEEAKGIILKKDDNEPFGVALTGAGRINASSVIIATGARWNSLNIPGEKELVGRGISYCATCDGPLFKGKDVAVIGGGDTAMEDALFLTKFAKKVTVVHRRDRLRAARILQERAFANKKIEFLFNSLATAVIGKNRIEAVKVKDVIKGSETTIKIDGLFVLIGITPNSEFVKGLVNTDDKGYIICDDNMRTSADGIFACGDVRKKLLRQVSTAVGDGATAAFSAQNYVEGIKGTSYK